MKYLTINDIKHQLNIDEDYYDEDGFIAQLGEVAESAVEKDLDINLEDIEDDEGNIPQPLIQAMLILVADFYQNRESVTYNSVNKIPNSLEYLLDLYRTYYKPHKKDKEG